MSNESQRKPLTTSSVINSVTAGYVAGICGTVVGHPLDSIKVLLQTNNFHSVTPPGNATTSSVAPTATSTVNVPANPVARNITTITSNPAPSRRSLRALYAGISGPLLTVGATQALMFSLYDTSRRMLYQMTASEDDKQNDYMHNDSLANVFCASTASGTIISVFTSPFQVVKTKQQIMVWSFKKALQDTPSVKSLFVGFRPHLFCEGLGRGVYFTTYELLKRTIVSRKQKSGDQSLNDMSITLSERALCAAVAGASCWAFIFPADVLRCRMYARAITSPSQQQGTWDSIQSIYRQGGNSIKPFYRGFWITVARAGPVAAAVLPCYDLVLEHLQQRH